MQRDRREQAATASSQPAEHEPGHRRRGDRQRHPGRHGHLGSDGVDGLYVSFDLDSVDASAFPGTGTPEPGGFSARETIKIARALGRAHPVAIDLVEIAPVYDLSGISTRLACGVALEILAGVCGR